jgi:hypothetical protein
MGKFRHTPDNGIFVNTLYMPLSFFILHEPLYSLPSPYTSRTYEQTVSHVVSDGGNAVALSIPYVDGDTYISKEAIYQAAYDLHLNPPPTLEQAKEIKISEMLSYSNDIKNGHVIVGGQEYFSDNIFLTKLINEDIKYTRAAALPVDYYINNINYFHVLSDFTNLEAIIDRIIELNYLCDLNADIHRAAINSLTTVLDVEAYNFTTGWETVPY